MEQDPTISIVATHGLWMHIRVTRVFHRNCPEIRGEGASPGDAATHLLNQLAHALDFTHGHKREAIERAIADVRRMRSAGTRRRPQPMTAIA